MTNKLLQEILENDQGFNKIWTAYNGILDHPILQEELLTRQFLLERFDLDNKRAAEAAIHRIGKSIEEVSET